MIITSTQQQVELAEIEQRRWESPPNILMANYDQQGFSLNDQVDYQIGLNKIDKRSSDNFMDYPAGADLQSVPHQTKNKQIKKR